MKLDNYDLTIAAKKLKGEYSNLEGLLFDLIPVLDIALEEFSLNSKYGIATGVFYGECAQVWAYIVAGGKNFCILSKFVENSAPVYSKPFVSDIAFFLKGTIKEYELDNLHLVRKVIDFPRSC